MLDIEFPFAGPDVTDGDFRVNIFTRRLLKGIAAANGTGQARGMDKGMDGVKHVPRRASFRQFLCNVRIAQPYQVGEKAVSKELAVVDNLHLKEVIKLETFATIDDREKG
jgi:hypothetical protein